MTNIIPIVIVSWNSSSVIKHALDCIARQTVSSYKVIIVDNASADIKELRALILEYSFCELIEVGMNIGFAAANNIAFKKLEDYEFVALLNPDAYPEDDWLESLLIAVKKYPDFHSFASRQLQSNPEILDGTGDQLSFSGQPFRRGYGKKAVNKYLKDEPVFSACAAAVMYRSKAIKDCKGFDESFFCYVEDVDLGFRMQLLGYKCMYVANAVVRHIGSSSLGKRSDFSVYYGQRNMVKCFIKNMPFPLILLLALPHVITNILYVLLGVLMGKKGLVLRAKIHAIAGWRSLYDARMQIQRTKKVSSFYIMKLLSLKKI